MRKEYNVYFTDGNHRILEADSVIQIMLFLVDEGTINQLDKIERRK